MECIIEIKNNKIDVYRGSSEELLFDPDVLNGHLEMIGGVIYCTNEEETVVLICIKREKLFKNGQFALIYAPEGKSVRLSSFLTLQEAQAAKNAIEDDAAGIYIEDDVFLTDIRPREYGVNAYGDMSDSYLEEWEYAYDLLDERMRSYIEGLEEQKIFDECSREWCRETMAGLKNCSLSQLEYYLSKPLSDTFPCY